MSDIHPLWLVPAALAASLGVANIYVPGMQFPRHDEAPRTSATATASTSSEDGQPTSLSSTGPEPSSSPSSDQSLKYRKDGASVLLAGDPYPGEQTDFKPSAEDAPKDFPSVSSFNACHGSQDDTSPQECEIHTAGKDRPVVVLIGDSHAAQWAPALEVIGSEQDITFLSVTKSACGVTTAPSDQPGSVEPYESCTEWNENLADFVEGLKPDAVITATSSYITTWGDSGKVVGDEGYQAQLEGHVEARQRLQQVAPVYELHDTPAPEGISECLKKADSAEECTEPFDSALGTRGQLQEAAWDQLGGTEIIDLNQYLCSESTCNAVVGGVTVWRDGNHMTATYSTTMAKPLWEKLKELPALKNA